LFPFKTLVEAELYATVSGGAEGFPMLLRPCAVDRPAATVSYDEK